MNVSLVCGFFLRHRKRQNTHNFRKKHRYNTIPSLILQLSSGSYITSSTPDLKMDRQNDCLLTQLQHTNTVRNTSSASHIVNELDTLSNSHLSRQSQSMPIIFRNAQRPARLFRTSLIYMHMYLCFFVTLLNFSLPPSKLTMIPFNSGILTITLSF